MNTQEGPAPLSAGVALDRYDISIIDPFGQPICAMMYYSFAPENEDMNWFRVVLGDDRSVRLPIPNKFNAAMAFTLEISKA